MIFIKFKNGNIMIVKLETMEKYSNSGKRWSNGEHHQLLDLYNVKKFFFQYHTCP